MAESYKRRWARLAEQYARLKDLYERSIQHRKILTDDLRDARAEATELRRELRDRQRGAERSMGKLVATARYTAQRLRTAGDTEAVEKIEDWLDDVEDNMVPLVEAERLVTLLQEWCDAMPLSNPDDVAMLYMLTMKELNDATGRDQPEP